MVNTSCHIRIRVRPYLSLVQTVEFGYYEASTKTVVLLLVIIGGWVRPGKQKAVLFNQLIEAFKVRRTG
ncbi:uncharacterized protein METZ01_LOCUS29453 [marine metagenome]|uniref:Uncharacterized protein n=1 Tax=marine metagenome TaxID=408172 RepID=A0A381QDX9_9ZZZZ